MHKEDLVNRNPLHPFANGSEDILPKGGFGAVMARAGVGKTAFVVQVALHTLLKDNKVLHISLNDPVKKVSLWYREVFRDIAGQYGRTADAKAIENLWDTLVPNRFIMTFQVETFQVPTLKERLTDLIEQGIFSPSMILIDGLPFDGNVRATLEELKSLSCHFGFHVWFTVVTHRHEEPAADGLPVQISGVSDLFDVVIRLRPEDKDIHVEPVKGVSAEGKPSILLDPATMLLKTVV